MLFVYTCLYACLHLSIPWNFLTQLTNFSHIYHKCNHLKDTKIPPNFMTTCDCPKSVPTTRAEIEVWAKPYQAPRIHLEKMVWMHKKPQSEYPAYHTPEDLTRRQNQRYSLLPWLTELPITFCEVRLFCRSLLFLCLPACTPNGLLSEMPVLLRTITFLTFLQVLLPYRYHMQARL